MLKNNNTLKIFKFTFLQKTHKKSFWGLTLIFPLVLILCTILLVLHFGEKKEDTKIDELKEVYLINDTEYDSNNIQTCLPEDVKNVNIHMLNSREDLEGKKVEEYVVDFLKEKEDSLVIYILKEKDKFIINSYVDEDTNVSMDETDFYCKNLNIALKQSMIGSLQQDENNVNEVQKVSVNKESIVGDENTEAQKEISFVINYVFVIVLMFIIAYRSQEVAYDISAEKTSKLVENILTSVKTSELIKGKLLANVSVIVISLMADIVGIAVGIRLGQARLLSKDSNAIDVMGKIKEIFASSGSIDSFSPISIIITFLLIILGIVLYFMLATIAGSMASKPEQLTSLSLVYSLPLFVVYYIQLSVQNPSHMAQVLLDYIPFSAPMSMPGKILVGGCSISYALICIAILLVTVLVMIKLAGNLYKGAIMYNGEDVSVKKMINLVKNH